MIVQGSLIQPEVCQCLHFQVLHLDPQLLADLIVQWSLIHQEKCCLHFQVLRLDPPLNLDQTDYLRLLTLSEFPAIVVLPVHPPLHLLQDRNQSFHHRDPLCYLNLRSF